MPERLRARSVVRLSPLRVSVIYTLVAVLWIVLSDRALGWLGIHGERWLEFQTAKGLVFVLSCGALIYVLTRWATRQAVAEHRRAEESELRYRALVDTLPVGVLVHVNGRIVFANRALVEITGLPSAETLLGRDVRQFVPPDRLPVIEERIRVLHEDRLPVPPMEYRIERETGEDVFVEFASAPIEFEGARAAIVVLRDVTERRRAFRRQRLLMSELDHRVRNNLSTILSIARSSLESSKTLAEFGEAFSGRVQALADTHNLLAEQRWERVSLRALLERIVTPYARPDAPHALRLNGPDLALPGDAASAASMMIHELATNAAKHGALSVSAGWVEVSWEREAGSGDLTLAWVERGGPSTTTPTTEGFGLSLLRSVVPYQLDGAVALEFRPEGLRCALRIPAANLAPGSAFVDDSPSRRAAPDAVSA